MNHDHDGLVRLHDKDLVERRHEGPRLRLLSPAQSKALERGREYTANLQSRADYDRVSFLSSFDAHAVGMDMTVRCLNRKVLLGLGAAAIAVLLTAPGVFGAVLPTLVLLVCPLSMVLMMRGMRGARGSGDATTGTSHMIDPASRPVVAEPDETQAEIARLRAKIEELKAQRVESPEVR